MTKLDRNLPPLKRHDVLKMEKRTDGLYFEVVDDRDPSIEGKFEAGLKHCMEKYGAMLSKLPND